MIPLEIIKNYFPPFLRDEAAQIKHILKEYIQLMILDYLSATPYIRKLVFIGGTNLRLVKGIDRFSEDLDFDCKSLSKEEFMAMTNDVLQFLERSGLKVETKEKVNTQLKAYRRNIYFPQLLFELGLTGHKEERFLLKIESQNQGVLYNPVITNIKSCGFFFPMPVPPDSVLCAMKLSALLSRAKGRDFYDAMFLLTLTSPDYHFLGQRNNVHNLNELKQAIEKLLTTINIELKSKDFEHLLFYKHNNKKILRFWEFIEAMR
ncbi:MAG: nucleotidyl transferase AbiEii/AbiGii toxin family protein [Bacteroidales bacterium]|jgi:predicted nucleotidyltransferase component of viral defense system|nr:nucleotidyl transferase AbiEii/AbiGii toxin family protein [Bacteroidales bacterium]